MHMPHMHNDWYHALHDMCAVYTQSSLEQCMQVLEAHID